MSEQSGQPAADQAPSPEPAARARRLAEIFGDVLPESTSDDREQPRVNLGGDSPGDSPGDTWYLENRPPHHGG